MNVPFTPKEVVAKILEATQPYEFRTFVVGFQRPSDSKSGEGGSHYRNLKRTVGTELCRRWRHRSVDFDKPELRLDVRENLEIQLHPAPIFLAGRYRKLSRSIPASRWLHLTCKGQGCPSCRYTGNLCGPSIQEIFSAPLLRATGGAKSLFHGLGREDTDARMLGNGRPFVIEIHRPRKRSLDLEPLLYETALAGQGLCELLEPRVVSRSAVHQVKNAAAEKTYRAWIRLGAPPTVTRRTVTSPTVTSPKVASRDVVESLRGQIIEQYSPTRVMHRRGVSKLRRRRIVDGTWLGDVDGLAVWEVRAEAGTYIKELISGDEGRTRPSLSGLLGVPAKCVALDVLDIHWRPPWEGAPESRQPSARALA